MKVVVSREKLQEKVNSLQLELALLEDKIRVIYDKPTLVYFNGDYHYKLFEKLSALTAKVESLENLLASTSNKNSVKKISFIGTKRQKM